MAVPLDFEAIFNASPNPYMLLTPDLRFAGANDAYLRTLGRRREDLIGQYLFEAFPGNPDDPDDSSVRQLRASFEKVIATREADTLALIPYAIARQTPDGVVFDERYWSATHTPLLDEHGAVAFILQHTVDVTELQQLKEALRAAEQANETRIPRVQVEEGVFRRARQVQEANRSLDTERLRLRRLFEQAPGFIAALEGPRHVFQLANEAYLQLIGKRDVLGKTVAEALPEVVGQGFLDLLDRVYTSGEPFVGRGIEIQLQRQPEAPLETLYLDFLYQPVVDAGGRVTGIFVQGHDVTEQKRVQAELHALNASLERRVEERTAQLEARNRELQDFAYIASHDLQEPLRKIRTFADMMRSDYHAHLDEQGRYYLDRMQDSATRMSRLINDLLAYSRTATRGGEYRRVDLGEVARDVLNDLQLRIEETGGTVHVGALPSVEANTAQMRQLLQNLIGNALKFQHPDRPPHVRVAGHVEADPATGAPVCQIEVEDNGIGFAEQYAERVFAPFQRLHNKAAYEGTGIGLAICRRIAERHGGAITARSTPGVGTTLVVRLPVHQPGVAD